MDPFSKKKLGGSLKKTDSLFSFFVFHKRMMMFIIIINFFIIIIITFFNYHFYLVLYFLLFVFYILNYISAFSVFPEKSPSPKFFPQVSRSLWTSWTFAPGSSPRLTKPPRPGATAPSRPLGTAKWGELKRVETAQWPNPNSKNWTVWLTQIIFTVKV